MRTHKPKKPKWVLRWETIHPFYRIEASFLEHRKAAILGSDYGNMMAFSKGGVVSMYYDEADLDRKTKESLKILGNADGMEAYFIQAEGLCKKLIEDINATADDLEHRSDGDLAKGYKTIIHGLGALHCAYDLSRPEYLSEVEKAIRDALDIKCEGSAEISRVLGILTSPNEETLMEEEQRDWLKIVLSIKKTTHKAERDALLRIHSEKYGWIGSSERDKPWTLEHYRKLLSEDIRLSEKEIEGRIKRKINQRRNLEKSQNRLTRKFKLNRRIKLFIEVVKRLAFLRMRIRLTWVESGHLMKKIFGEISRRSGVKAEILESYSEDEMVNLIQKGRRPKIDRSAYAFLLKGGKCRLYEGVSAESLMKTQLPPIPKTPKANELQGNIANPGYARGRAKVINSLTEDQDKESQKMKKGEILITGMTRPHLILAMRKAAAIVTDEGGIASHAAIVSRELGIPCVIGTKDATKTFKDGDMIEVDADKGLVRRIG